MRLQGDDQSDFMPAAYAAPQQEALSSVKGRDG